MSVLLVTSAGELVIDLFVDACPVACENFAKLCAMKFYNSQLIYNVQQNYIMQSGDPTATGQGGTSVYGLLHGKERRYFPDEINAGIKTNKVGYVGMARIGQTPNTNQSQFFITLRGEDMEHFGKEYTIFGQVAEGMEVLEVINNLFCDADGRPYQDVRILHTYILDDPFPDPKGFVAPPSSPVREFPLEEKVKRRIPYDPNPSEPSAADGRTEEEIDESIRKKEAKSRAIVLEMVGDLPDADVKPPDEVLFVCKLNPITRDEDLELIFSRFGTIKSCEIIRDHKTGDSLNYAFIEFEAERSCIEAYEKMNNAIIDERRIKVDFSQSVSKLWNRFLFKPRGAGAGAGRKPATKPPTAQEEQQLAVYGRGREPDRSAAESKTQEGRGGRADSRERRDGRRDRDQRDRAPRRDSRSRDRHRANDQDHPADRARDRNGDRDRSRDNGRDQHRDRHRDRDRDRSRDRGGDRDRDRVRSRDRGGDRDRDRVRDRARDQDRDRARRS